MSKKNRNKLKRKRNQTNDSSKKKSIQSAPLESSSHQPNKNNINKCNQIEIIQTKQSNDKYSSSNIKIELFSLKPFWMNKQNCSFNCNKSIVEKKNSYDLNENVLLEFKIRINFNLLELLLCQNFTFFQPNLLCLSNINYRFDLIIDFLNLIREYFSNTSANSLPKMSKKKKRAGYIIERDCHIFGGCQEEDAQDEFFISSGAVYQSWPYVYEPGFKLTPLIEHINWPLSKSADSVYLNEFNEDFVENDSFVEQDDLPAYSIENFEINLFNVDKRKRKGKKWNSNGSDDSDYTSTDECFYEDSDSDDSESIIAYKQRHAVGLNCFNFELKSVHRPANKFSSVYYDESSKDRKIQFLSQKQFDKSVNDFNCYSQDFFASRKDKFVQAHKYSYSSDNLVF